MKNLIATLLFMVSVTAFAEVDRNSHFVCGTQYDTEHALSKSNLMEKLKAEIENPTRSDAAQMVVDYLSSPESSIDESLAIKFLNQIEVSREFNFASAPIVFNITKTINNDMSSKQMLFIHTDDQIELPYKDCSDAENQLNDIRYLARFMRATWSM